MPRRRLLLTRLLAIARMIGGKPQGLEVVRRLVRCGPWTRRGRGLTTRPRAGRRPPGWSGRPRAGLRGTRRRVGDGSGWARRIAGRRRRCMRRRRRRERVCHGCHGCHGFLGRWSYRGVTSRLYTPRGYDLDYVQGCGRQIASPGVGEVLTPVALAAPLTDPKGGRPDLVLPQPGRQAARVERAPLQVGPRRLVELVQPRQDLLGRHGVGVAEHGVQVGEQPNAEARCTPLRKRDKRDSRDTGPVRPASAGRVGDREQRFPRRGR